MSVFETRFDQLFPVFGRLQMETARRFANGEARHFAPGELIYDVGVRNAPVWLVLDGGIEIVRRDGLHRESSVVLLSEGQFSGEVSSLAGRGTLAAGRAGPDGCTALPFDAAHIRALVIGSAELGEILMRAFILRRVALIQDGGAGSLLIDRGGSPDLLRLQGFLARNGYPYTVLDAATDEEARAAVERFGIQPHELPLMICPNGACSSVRATPKPACVSASRRSSIRARSTMSPWSAPVRPVLPPRSMARRKDFRSSCSTSAPSAARPALRRASRTISAFPPAFPARRWRARVQPGAEVRRRDRHPARGHAARLRRRRPSAAASRSVWRSPMASRSARARWSSPRARATAGRISRTCRTSTATAFRIGPRRSRPSCAKARRWR